MKILIVLLCLLFIFPFTAIAGELEPPEVPQGGEKYIPPDTESFSEGLWYIIKTAVGDLNPSIAEAAKISLSLICIVLLISVLIGISDASRKFIFMAAAVSIGVLLLKPSNSLINLASETVAELSQYGKLLLPVMSAALAAQGGTTSSAAVYSGSSLFCAILTSLLSKIVVPLIYIFLCLTVAEAAIGENILNNLKKFIKWLVVWSLKIVLYTFSGYMGITKIITGSVDASALRAAKLTISGMVPVVGKIISDSSETILVSAGIVKNSVGVYGLWAIIAVLIGPFLRIGIQYLLLKLTASLCSVFGVKKLSDLIVDFSNSLAMLLGMIGTMALMLLISTVCFMKGVL